MKRFRVTDMTGETLDVRAVDWMMAMAEARRILGFEVASWVCHSLPDGAMYVADPVSGFAWSVEAVHDATPPGALRRVPPPSGRVPTLEDIALPDANPNHGYTPPAPDLDADEPPADAPPADMPVADEPPADVGPTEEPPAVVDTPAATDARATHGADAPPPDLAERLFERSMDLSFADGPDAAARIAVDIVREFVPCEAASVLLGGVNDPSLVFAAASGPAADGIVGRSVPFGRGLAGAAYDSGVTIRVTDASKDRRHLRTFDDQTGFVTRSVLCVPVRHAGSYYGVIQCLNAPGDFLPWHVEAVETVAQALATTLEGRLG